MQEQNVWGGWLISNAYVGIKRSSKQSGAGASTFRRRLGVCSPTLRTSRFQTRTLNRAPTVNYSPNIAVSILPYWLGRISFQTFLYTGNSYRTSAT
jgi:hypothetical protein